MVDYDMFEILLITDDTVDFLVHSVIWNYSSDIKTV